MVVLLVLDSSGVLLSDCPLLALVAASIWRMPNLLHPLRDCLLRQDQRVLTDYPSGCGTGLLLLLATTISSPSVAFPTYLAATTISSIRCLLDISALVSLTSRLPFPLPSALPRRAIPTLVKLAANEKP